jgi:hypothetical protein
MKTWRVKWAGRIESIGEKRNVYRTWVGKPEEKKTLGRSRSRWRNNIRMSLKAVGCEGVDANGRPGSISYLGVFYLY